MIKTSAVEIENFIVSHESLLVKSIECLLCYLEGYYANISLSDYRHSTKRSPRDHSSQMKQVSSSIASRTDGIYDPLKYLLTMEIFCENSVYRPLTIFTKSFIIDVFSALNTSL